jgi:PAS domain S-box-containing protein
MKPKVPTGDSPTLRRRVRVPASVPQQSGHASESEEIVRAIRQGEIDALVMSGTRGDHVLTLQGAEHPYRVLVERINDGVATLDTEGTILYANNRFAEILRVSLENFIGTSLQSHMPSSAREVLQSLIARGLHNNTQGELSLGSKGRRPRLVRFVVHPLENSELHSICVVATELTELVEANEALKSNEESLRQLSTRLLCLQDEERRHIARDLHDITGQKLALQSITLSQVLKKETAGLDEESRRSLSECAALTKEVGEEIRTLSYLLHPPLLDELGLPSALKWYAEGFEKRTGIAIELDISLEFQRLPPDVEVTLFRVIQESLTNVHRYSDSARASVQLKSIKDQIRVQVADFGKGMPREKQNSAPGTATPLGVGIQGMKERMRQLAGTLEITSQANQGTQVTATLPLSHVQIPVPPEFAAASSSRGTVATGQQRGVPRKRILIADDHEMLRRGVRTMLQKGADWEICGEAINGQDAVDKATALHPDLVILDINMPVLNGLAAVRQILRNSPQTKILVFTVHDSDQTLKEIRAAGAHGYLSKAKGGEDLLRVVKDLLPSKSISSAAVSH